MLIDLAELPNAWEATPKDMHRFLDKVEVDDCWVWTAAIAKATGYGYFSFRARMKLAHRFSYALFVGPIPEELQIDHLCRVRHCVNPEHLEAVTGQVNLIRGETIAARYAERTHCANGHEFTEENTRRGRRTPNSRECRACIRESVAAIRARAKANA